MKASPGWAEGQGRWSRWSHFRWVLSAPTSKFEVADGLLRSPTPTDGWIVLATSLAQLSRLRQGQKGHQMQTLAHGGPHSLIPSSQLMTRHGLGLPGLEFIPSQQFRCSSHAGRSADMNWYRGWGINSDLVYLLIYRCNHLVLTKTPGQKGLDLPFSLPATAIQKPDVKTTGSGHSCAVSSSSGCPSH